MYFSSGFTKITRLCNHQISQNSPQVFNLDSFLLSIKFAELLSPKEFMSAFSSSSNSSTGTYPRRHKGLTYTYNIELYVFSTSNHGVCSWRSCHNRPVQRRQPLVVPCMERICHHPGAFIVVWRSSQQQLHDSQTSRNLLAVPEKESKPNQGIPRQCCSCSCWFAGFAS